MPEQKKAKPEKRKFDLVVDIQEKMAQGKNGGYVRWAKKYNVKQFAESILFLQQHNIHDKELFPSGGKMGYDGKEPGCGCNRSKSKEAGA